MKIYDMLLANAMMGEGGGGGGGSSDFSTAQVTVTNDSYSPFSMSTIIVVPELGLEGTYPTTDNLSSPFTIILYKGKAYIALNNVSSTSGNITQDADTGLYVITGDCSITFENPLN